MRQLWLAVLVSFAIGTGVARASQAQNASTGGSTGAIEGDVATQRGTIKLPGALVERLDAGGGVIDRQATDSNGHFSMTGVAPGSYRLRASLSSFQTSIVPIVVTAGRTVVANFDVPLAAEEQLTVTAQARDVLPDDVAAPAAVIDSTDIDQFIPSGSFQDVMRLLPIVIDVPGGLSIKGGRPEQSAVQLDAGTVVEPSTGQTPLVMPADAIESVAVLPNPYAAEFGRFSAGLVVISTRAGAHKWRFRLNDLDPDLRTKRDSPFSVIGVRAFGPRLEIGGPLVKDRLSLEQVVQYNYSASDVASLPETELIEKRWLSTFTRLDVAGPKHSFVVSGGVFLNRSDDATLGTFVPPQTTVNIRGNMLHASAAARSLWNHALQSESSVSVRSYTTNTEPHGTAPMELRPDAGATVGDFFNRQRRDTATYQFVNTTTASRTGPWGTHDVKLGVDLLANRYRGSSVSGPVLVELPDATVVRRLDYSGSTTQDIPSVDVAVFAQDRVQVSTRYVVEFGVRLDRDGVLHQVNLTPRVGAAMGLNRSQTAVLHAGLGVFSERTPSEVAAFGQFQNVTDTRFFADGTAPIVVQYPNVTAPDLKTARSLVWSVTFDHRVNSTWSWNAGVLDRNGSSGLTINPIVVNGAGELLLDSNGSSRYRDAEAGVQFTHAGFDVSASYVRSSSRENLNAFTAVTGLVPTPIVGRDAYGPSNTDVPNRFFVRGRFATKRWLVLGIEDWHSGFPYSIVNGALDYVGPRNVDFRLPNVQRTQLGIERRFRVLGADPWIGIRVDNPFNTFSPTDVQANLASPDFGALYNSAYRKARIIVRFAR